MHKVLSKSVEPPKSRTPHYFLVPSVSTTWLLDRSLKKYGFLVHKFENIWPRSLIKYWQSWWSWCCVKIIWIHKYKVQPSAKDRRSIMVRIEVFFRAKQGQLPRKHNDLSWWDWECWRVGHQNTNKTKEPDINSLTIIFQTIEEKIESVSNFFASLWRQLYCVPSITEKESSCPFNKIQANAQTKTKKNSSLQFL